MLAGRYRLEDRVRTRPGGSLWAAVDETLDLPVLVQAFAPGHPHALEIVDSARRAALVEDPRLQRVLAAGEERSTAYVVLDRLRGRSLVDLVGNGPLPAETARRVIGEAAQALDRATARGLHHLRLRPTSLFVSDDGAVTVVGTAIDAAADGAQESDRAAATRSDAVGLVALLYTALTGRWPGSQDAGLARAPRVAGRPVAPGDLVAGVPNDLDTLCSVALGPHGDGPLTPGELAGQLSPWAPAAGLTDPRGLHLGGPSRPGTEVPLPPRDRPADPGERRTPAWGLRLRRPSGGAEVAAAGSVAAAVATDAAAAGSARPAWATVDELRRALRRTSASTAASPGPSAAAPTTTLSPTAPAPAPAGGPLATPVPPVGGPVAAGTTPHGAPLADAAPPAGAPTAPTAATDGATPVSGAPPLPAEPVPAEPLPGAPVPVGPVPAEQVAPDPGLAEPRPVEQDPAQQDSLQPQDRPTPQDRAHHHLAGGLDEGPVTQAMPAAAAAASSSPAPSGAAPTQLVPTSPPPRPAPARDATQPGAAPMATPAGATEVQAPVRVPAGRGVAGDGTRGGPAAVSGLELFAAQSEPVGPAEPVAPFGPDAPLTRPPREQSRLVMGLLAVFVVLVGVVAGRQLFSFDPAPLILSGGGAPTASRTPAAGTPRPTASTPAPSTPGAPSAVVAVAGAQAIDPQGDDNEYNELAARAVDDDPGTAWRSERYDSATFGGVKKGVGLALDLGDPSVVRQVTLDAPGSDGTVEIRAADSPDVDGSTVLATGRIDGGGPVVLPIRRPASTRYLIVWFTRVPQQQNGENRVLVDEIDVR